MKSKLVFITGVILGFFVIIAFLYNAHLMKSLQLELSALQKDIDGIFEINFRLLSSNLALDINDLQDDELLIYQNEIARYSYAALETFSQTTYKENEALHEVVKLVESMAEKNQLLTPCFDDVLVESITYLSFHLEDQAASEQVLDELHKIMNTND